MTTKVTDKIFVIILLDESGSMGPLQKDVIGGLNRYVKELKAEEGNYTLQIRKFDASGNEPMVRTLIDWTPLDKVRKFTDADYRPRGMTPLYDAVGLTLNDVSIPKGAKTLAVVYTDGAENQSREWTAEKVKTLIQKLEKKGWAFAYLGAGLAGWTRDAVNMGFAAQSMATSAVNTGASTAGSFMALRQVTSNYSAGTATVNNLYSGISQDLLDGKGTPATTAPVTQAVPKKKRVIKVK